jgi:hypothetical protein
MTGIAAQLVELRDAAGEVCSSSSRNGCHVSYFMGAARPAMRAGAELAPRRQGA